MGGMKSNDLWPLKAPPCLATPGIPRLPKATQAFDPGAYPGYPKQPLNG